MAKKDMKSAELDAANSVTESVWRRGSRRVCKTSKSEVWLPSDKSRWVSKDESPNNIGRKRSQLRATIIQHVYSRRSWGKREIHLNKVSIYKRLSPIWGRGRGKPCQPWKETSCEAKRLMEFPRMKPA